MHTWSFSNAVAVAAFRFLGLPVTQVYPFLFHTTKCMAVAGSGHNPTHSEMPAWAVVRTAASVTPDQKVPQERLVKGYEEYTPL